MEPSVFAHMNDFIQSFKKLKVEVQPKTSLTRMALTWQVPSACLAEVDIFRKNKSVILI